MFFIVTEELPSLWSVFSTFIQLVHKQRSIKNVRLCTSLGTPTPLCYGNSICWVSCLLLWPKVPFRRGRIGFVSTRLRLDRLFLFHCLFCLKEEYYTVPWTSSNLGTSFRYLSSPSMKLSRLYLGPRVMKLWVPLVWLAVVSVSPFHASNYCTRVHCKISLSSES